MSYTLVTAFDDCVRDYPFLAYEGGGVEDTTQALVRHLLFGDKILIDSAFFIHNSEIKKYITSEFDNILKIMICLGRVIIISETGSIIKDVKVKQLRNEHKSRQFNEYDLHKEFDRADSWLSGLNRNPYMILDINGDSPLRMRRSLISNILKASHPQQIGSYISNGSIFERFQSKLLRRIHDSPRSACKDSLAELRKEGHAEFEELKSGIMTYANQAFHLAFAAHLSEHQNIDVEVESFYSSHFAHAIPYKKSQKQRTTIQNIYVPLRPVLENKNNIMYKLFDDSVISRSRSEYLEDEGNKVYALIYEQNLYRELGLPHTFTELREEVINRMGPYVAIASATGAEEAARHIYKIVSRPISRRFLFQRAKYTAEALAFATVTAGFIRGIESVTTKYAADINSEGTIDTLSGNVTRTMIVNGYNENEDVHLPIELVLKAMSDSARGKFAYPESICYNAPISKLSPDIKSERYLEWKRNEGII